jgi:hypothetical protein
MLTQTNIGLLLKIAFWNRARRGSTLHQNRLNSDNYRQKRKTKPAPLSIVRENVMNLNGGDECRRSFYFLVLVQR